MSDQVLTKDDLLNMMDSYRSNVEFNKQLIESQEDLITEQGQIIDKLSEIADIQKDISTNLKEVVKTLTEHNTSCNNSIVEASSNLKEVQKKLDDSKIDNIKEYSKIKNLLITISGGLVAVIIALVLALEKMWSKADIIDEVAKYIGI